MAPTSLDFGGLALGKERSLQVVVTNVLATPQSPAFSSGAPSDATTFGVSQDCSGTTLAPGGSCTFTYTFKPTTVGPHNSNATIGIGTVNRTIALVGIGTDGCEATPTGSSPFPDVAASSTHGPAIICLAGLGVISGLSGGSFGPSQGVTRGQLASFAAHLLRVAGVDVPATGTTPFTDIAGSVHADNIGAIFQLGVIRGITATTFGPDIPVTREQIATILAVSFAVATGSDLAAGPDAFGDDNGSVHEPNINRVAAAGIATGTGPGTFDPHGGVTRAQVASFLARLLDAILDA